MSLFQKSVEQKYLKQLDFRLINAKYSEFKAYFGNPEIQENIRNSKEEQFQEGFLSELFVKILGYTLNPSPNFNLTTEYKNIKDSKKADGAILIDSDKGACSIVKAVIELKGTNTTDLGKIEAQAFGYKNNQPDCVYIITSNFEKLRFYIDNAIEFIEFNLFKLTKIEFEILFLCLAYDQIAKGIPKKVKADSVSQEDVITKKLYSDYSLFKRELHQNLVSQNPQFDALTLFRKSQKLLDRFLFLFFAEDRQLLPPNSVRLVLNDWKDLQERDEEIPLYNRFKKYFGYLNTGYKGKRYDVFAYNGGLFKPDEILDAVVIDDNLLYKHALKLSEYDFASEVDVNILGHIFENSLNELDEIQAQLDGREIDKTKTKRKKEGVFYTPKYITKYIVENTVGKLCTEKKAELQFNEEDYTTDKKRQIKTKQALLEKLKTYQNWLLQLTICDPACGSGAFLNQALDFLITEHRYIDELQAKLLGVPMILSDVEKSILENNLFGVDLNEESVEIAKLSLWLRTAQPNRKLNDLSNNIKCGNSLISDPAIAGNKAFDWEREFPQVFHKKQKRAWHITCATHNSRYSQRMFDNFVKLGDPVWLSEKEEIIVTETLAKIVESDKLNIPAYNICGDHMHLILVCEVAELASIVQKIKSMTARACNIAMGRTIPTDRTPDHTSPEPGTQAISVTPAIPEDTLATRGTAQAHLWTQKFGNKEITSEEQLLNTIEYIRNNRIKHGLPELGKTAAMDKMVSTDAIARRESNKGACSLVKSTPSYYGSLVESIYCSIEHAFRTEYTGGFDVVIGNPPYVRAELISHFTEFFRNRYKTYQPAADLFTYFYEVGFNITNSKGLFGYISNTFDKTKAAIELRDWLKNNTTILKYVDFTEVQIFEGATTYPIIFIAKNDKPLISQFQYIKIKKGNEQGIEFYNPTTIEQDNLEKENWAFRNNQSSDIINKLRQNPLITEKFGKTYRGLITGLNEAFLIPKELINEEFIKPIYEGWELNKWSNYENSQSLILFKSKWTKAKFGDLNDSDALEKTKEFQPRLIQHLMQFEQKAKARYDKGDYWWELRNCSYYHLFEQPKIIFPNLQNRNKFSLDEKGIYVNAPAVMLSLSHLENPISEGKFLLGILNSKLIWYFLKSICVVRSGGYIEVKPQYFEQIPIPSTSPEYELPLMDKVEFILDLNKQLQSIIQKFQRTIQRKFNAMERAPLANLPGKLQNWYLLSYSEFIVELGKKKVKLSLAEEAEWEDYFLQEAKKALEIKAAIESTDKEIDQMVYQLYELTDEEIKIVEGA